MSVGGPKTGLDVVAKLIEIRMTAVNKTLECRFVQHSLEIIANKFLRQYGTK
jgi:hypothetical protein